MNEFEQTIEKQTKYFIASTLHFKEFLEVYTKPHTKSSQLYQTLTTR